MRWLCNWLYTKLSLFQKNLKLIAVDLSKKQELFAKAIQQINFTGNLDQDQYLFYY